MTASSWGSRTRHRHPAKPENKCRSFGSAEKRFAQDDRLFLGQPHPAPAPGKTEKQMQVLRLR
jgi:hypothetical protein